MARADLLLNLVKAAGHGDDVLMRRTVEAIAAEERAKRHDVLADRLLENLSSATAKNGAASPSRDSIARLVWESHPDRHLSDLILPATARTAVEELIEEHHRADLLRSYGLEPRHSVFLAGPPGTGKTSVAAAIASSVLMPLVSVRYEAVIGSYLGETASRLERIFEYARSRRCVLFFDEFDTLGKERGDTNETGEIKRVVSSLLLQVDALPSHVIVVAASNHPELMDRAVWRRFQLRLHLPLPGTAQREEWFKRFQGRSPIHLHYSPAALARATVGASFAEIEEFGVDLVRRAVLAGPGTDTKKIVSQQLAQWKARFSPGTNCQELE